MNYFFAANMVQNPTNTYDYPFSKITWFYI